MKRILLTSTALVAFAGAAAAEGHTSITNALSAKLGYNSENNPGEAGENGFYWEGNLKTTATATLDNGLTAGAYFEITIDGDDATSSNDFGKVLSSSDFVVSLTSETAGLYYGDTGTAANRHWTSAGDMEADGFTSGTDSAVLRGDVMFAGVDASVSYVVDDAADSVEQLSVGAKGSFGAFGFSVGYQEESDYVDTNGDFNGDEITAVSVSGSFAGADVTVGYADNATDGLTSTGIQVAYPIGPVTATAYYVSEDSDAGDVDDNLGLTLAYASGPVSVTAKVRDEQGRNEYNVEGTYDVGNGLEVLAGVLNENEGDDADYYVGGRYDLGGGANVLFAYAADEDGDQGDEIGVPELDPGVTVEVSFAF